MILEGDILLSTNCSPVPHSGFTSLWVTEVSNYVSLMMLIKAPTRILHQHYLILFGDTNSFHSLPQKITFSSDSGAERRQLWLFLHFRYIFCVKWSWWACANSVFDTCTLEKNSRLWPRVEWRTGAHWNRLQLQYCLLTQRTRIHLVIIKPSSLAGGHRVPIQCLGHFDISPVHS